MQKLLSGKDVKRLDKAFIQFEGISSLELMERAASKFVEWFIQRFQTEAGRVIIICGTGNNGGDGLAIGRLLFLRDYVITIYTVGDVAAGSGDFSDNIHRLPLGLPLKAIDDASEILLEGQVIIDALFGVGINRPISGMFASVVQRVNESSIPVVSVDLPSGLPADDLLQGDAVKASHTVTFQFPKRSLLLPEHAAYSGEVSVVSIGMDSFDYSAFESKLYYVQARDIPSLHKVFHRFSHKGSFGKFLLIGGSLGKMGAVALGGRAALRTGSGLVSVCVPRCGLEPIQCSVPEVMVEVCLAEQTVSLPLPDCTNYSAIGIGPGMGTTSDAYHVLEAVLSCYGGPMVLDADAINLLALHPHLHAYLKGRVLTPHLVEFERLVGSCAHHLERMDRARAFAMAYSCVVVLKGANTVVSLPDGVQVVNSSGTHYMATGGSGDVLTGIIGSFLGQGYSPEKASICGVFHHGLAGELASVSRRRGTIASDILEAIPETFLKMNIL
ncbi:MAG: NAD(P)H-hydrate dehydratase [Lunatimonas sp.]|uniref:NAD(P)H-hydrate dehydratase n=1 Tax=Lunatimonas sp. TaxID=2060141 RepID=UPI00263B0830|nr:NAD(P)H-hydrate dehydratase [Lunatimonas sp.]MCC5936386.1 NAD(P)H-hydrate dehydratase [Lunatimonas sp.]